MGSVEVSFPGILREIGKLAGNKTADLRTLEEESMPKFGISDRNHPSEDEPEKILTEIEFCFTKSGEFVQCDEKKWYVTIYRLHTEVTCLIQVESHQMKS